MYYGITFPTPSQPFSQSFSQPLSESLSLHCSILSHCSHLCLIILFSTSYCSFDLPLSFDHSWSFSNSSSRSHSLLLSLLALFQSLTLSIAHCFNSHSFVFLLSTALLPFHHAFSHSLVPTLNNSTFCSPPLFIVITHLLFHNYFSHFSLSRSLISRSCFLILILSCSLSLLWLEVTRNHSQLFCNLVLTLFQRGYNSAFTFLWTTLVSLLIVLVITFLE